MKRIFVQMVSYRDPECHHTLADMFARAAHPERVFVGLCWQYDPAEDAEMIAVPYPRADQVRVVQFHARDAQGAGWARNEAQKLWAGEEYILQVQAHMRFEQGWDESLIELLENLPTKKAILTAWLPTYTPPDKKQILGGQLPVATINRLGDESDSQMIHLIKNMAAQNSFSGPFLTCSWVGNFMFTHAQTLQEVPFDPHIFWWGEEINYSARLWTHGYDIYHLDRAVLYHYWDRNGGKESYRDHSDKRNKKSLARNLHLFGIWPSQRRQIVQEIEKYSLGTVRSLADYFAFIGVNLRKGTIATHARLGHFHPLVRPKIFVAIASFRDPELGPTLHDMFTKAAHPERIFAGVCQQVQPAGDADCAVAPHKQVRIKQVDYRESEGANWARAQAVSMRADEEYILQIDSHMRFEQDWDEALIEMLERAGEDAAISAYLPNYTPPDMRDQSPEHILRMCVRKLGEEGDPQLVHLTGVHRQDAELRRTPFAIANFLFGRAELWRRVPIDPNIYFHGDEITLSARLWTHGIAIFQPDQNVAYHYWARYDQLSKHPYRSPKTRRAAETLERIEHLLGRKKTDNKEIVQDLERYGLGDKQSLESFWEFAGVDLNTRQLSEKAQEGLWEMTEKKPRIFVQIASYRDPDCQHTVADMYAKATHPERIFTGICWQFVKEEDAVCFSVPYPYPDQVRVTEIDARQGKGACWARSLTQQLWRGEEFTLQIDSHMRFEKGWDDILISMWESIGNPKSILTCYPPGFTPPDKLEDGYFYGMAAKEFDAHGIFKMIARPAYTSANPPKAPIPGAFAGACMFFGPASIIQDVPYDPHLYFFGEEISLAVRFWTHGYDIYHPNNFVLYHDWDRNKRPTHFTDHPKTWGELDRISLARVRHMLGTETSHEPQVLAELDKYGLGTVRTLAEYQHYSGVDFAAKTFSDAAEKGIFAAPGAKPRIFVRIASYRDEECQWTVKDLFEKAKHPDRIKVGICWQFDEKDDAHCFEITTRPDQVQIIPYDWRDSEGVCWARAQTEILFEDEEYTLQIDSHMRFAPDWDERLIDELAQCPSPKPVLSASPARYTPPNNLDQNPMPTVRRVLPFNHNGNIRGRGEWLEVEPPAPLPGAFVAAGFMFARSSILREVPYDPFLYFDQEEITLAMRLYTHGWDVFSPHKQYLYHYYNEGDSARPLHDGDLRQSDPEKLRKFSARGLARFNHLSGYQASTDSAVLADIGKYALGTARSLAAFEAFSGIDFRKKTVSKRALECEFIPDLKKYRPTPMGEMTGHVLEAGDRLPYFILDDTEGKARAVEAHAGRPALLFFLPFADPAGNAPFFRALTQAIDEAGKLDCSLLFVLDATVAELQAFKAQYKLPFILMADANRALAQSLGVGESICAFLLDANLQVKQKYHALAPATLASNAVAGMKALLAAPKADVAPVLVLADVLTPALCEELLAAFRGGDKFPGMVGAANAYVSTAKVREDFIVPEQLRRKIDAKLAQSLFPEIEKIFGFKVAARENYRIGSYRGDAGGYFAPHRDNFDPELGYRRIAVTLHLTDDYEGGGMRFAEYGPRVYRPNAGGAVAFSCGMMHEGLKVTKGERIVLVGFFHGAEEEKFRQDRARMKGEPVQAEEFALYMPELAGIRRSRDFAREWESRKIEVPVVVPVAQEFVKTPLIGIGRAKHTPVKMYESKGGVVFDNFLPPDLFERIRNFAIETTYERINSGNKISRAWHLHDGFPLRSSLNAFYYSEKMLAPTPKPPHIYPTGTALDHFIDFMVEFQPQVEYYTGKPAGTGSDGWQHFSVTSWLYPPTTGLSMHDDGSGVYTGAYAFFLNPVWRSHWGGMLVLMDDSANEAIHAHRRSVDQVEFYNQKWLGANKTEELLLEQGLGRCIFPKGNRMVFIANDAYHMVTRVNEAAGDNIRMSLAGFFDRKKK